MNSGLNSQSNLAVLVTKARKKDNYWNVGVSRKRDNRLVSFELIVATARFAGVARIARAWPVGRVVTTTRLSCRMSNVFIALVMMELCMTVGALDQGRVGVVLSVVARQSQPTKGRYNVETNFMVGHAARRGRANHHSLVRFD